MVAPRTRFASETTDSQNGALAFFCRHSLNTVEVQVLKIGEFVKRALSVPSPFAMRPAPCSTEIWQAAQSGSTFIVAKPKETPERTANISTPCALLR
tara:strand:+ start:294 stop:584 length:291 start_codon:yes stop_codon:yes gene_type:complete